MKSELKTVFGLLLTICALFAVSFVPPAHADGRVNQDENGVAEATSMTTIYKSIGGRVYARAVPTAILGSIAQASTHAGAPDLTVTWKCKAGTVTKNYWKADYADAHEMDVAAAHEIEQCQSIALFTPID
jgi:hypothetical protein